MDGWVDEWSFHCLLDFAQAGDKGDEVNPVVKLFLVAVADTTSVHKNIAPPREFADQ